MLLIFDLDGTLIDSRLDLANAVNAARAELGRNALPHELIYSYVGNGAPVLIQRAMGPDAADEEVAAALDFFLSYYRSHSLVHTVVYPGVREALARFYEAGMQLAVLTNKPVRISNEIMRALELSHMLFQVYGGNSFPHKKPHPIGIDTLRAEASAAAGETWMVGDSGIDIQTARNAGVRSCGVSYGFQPESLEEFPPEVLVNDLRDFASFLLPSNPARI